MADRWCECGAATNDPVHDAWHKLWWWNTEVFRVAAGKRQAAFDKELETHDYRHGRAPVDPQGTLAVDYTPAGNTYSR